MNRHLKYVNEVVDVIEYVIERRVLVEVSKILKKVESYEIVKEIDLMFVSDNRNSV